MPEPAVSLHQAADGAGLPEVWVPCAAAVASSHPRWQAGERQQGVEGEIHHRLQRGLEWADARALAEPRQEPQRRLLRLLREIQTLPAGLREAEPTAQR